ncbi:hypothetical protein P170DRAFT_351640, partial [Aspergillus steynii IBT 23096]
INGTLLSPPNPSVARQEPSEENDAEWLKYNLTPLFGLTRDEIIKLGKDPEAAARYDREHYGLDEDIYVGKLDVSHQIHCLDSIRQKAFADYPGYHPEHSHHRKREWNETTKGWIHLGHCVDMLLQFLLCNSDPTVLAFTYVEGQQAPWPDFKINRQCRDFNSLVEWTKSRELKGWEDAPRPKDAFLWPNPFVGEPDFELGFPLGHHHQQEGNPNRAL